MWRRSANAVENSTEACKNIMNEKFWHFIEVTKVYAPYIYTVYVPHVVTSHPFV